MTEEKQGKQNLIPKSASDALMAGGATGLISLAGSLFFDIPGEQAFKMATGVFLSGAGYSLYLSWSDSRNKSRPKSRSRKGRQVVINHARGSQKVDLEYSVATGSYLTRETYLQAVKRKMFGDSSKRSEQSKITVNKPDILQEFIFKSHYNGSLIELREKHVKLFLSNAYRLTHGKCFSERHWDRRRSQRPAWYKELPSAWYYGMKQLIIDTQHGLKVQMIIRGENGWCHMAYEPREFYHLLKWFEWERRHARQ